MNAINHTSPINIFKVALSSAALTTFAQAATLPDSTLTGTTKVEGPIQMNDAGVGTSVAGQWSVTLEDGLLIWGDPATSSVFGHDFDLGDTLMLWYPDKAAFRAGEASATSWDEANIGSYSVAFGRGFASGVESMAWGHGNASGTGGTAWGGSSASGVNSTAWGALAWADGSYSTAWGEGNAFGSYSTAWGLSFASGNYSTTWGGANILANAAYSTAFGDYNISSNWMLPNSSSLTTWVWTDPLLEIGNGYDDFIDGIYTNAFTILKNGKTAIGTHANFPSSDETLTVHGALKVGDYDDFGTASPVAGAIRYDSTANDFEGYDGSGWKSLTQSSTATSLVDSNGNTVLSVDVNGGLSVDAGSSVTFTGPVITSSSIELSDSTVISSASDLQAAIVDPGNGVQLITSDDSGDLVIAYSDTDATGAVQNGSMLRQGDTEGRGTFEWNGRVSTSSTTSSKKFYIYISEETQGLWGYFDVTLMMPDWSAALGYGTGALVKRYNIGYRHGNEPNLLYEFLTNTSQVISANGGTAEKAILGDLEKDPVSGDLRILVQLKGGHRSQVTVHVVGLNAAPNSFDGFPYLTTLGPSSVAVQPDNAVELNKLEVTTSLRLPDGSATEPALTFSNDSDSGLFLPEDGHVTLATAGEPRLTVDNLGNVGIGTATPTVALDVVGDLNVSGQVVLETPQGDISMGAFGTL